MATDITRAGSKVKITSASGFVSYRPAQDLSWYISSDGARLILVNERTREEYVRDTFANITVAGAAVANAAAANTALETVFYDAGGSALTTQQYKQMVNDPTYFFTHFVDMTGFVTINSGGIINHQPLAGRMGILQLSTSSSATGKAGIARLNNNNNFGHIITGQGSIEVRALVQFSALSTAVEEFKFFFGFATLPSSTADPMTSANFAAFTYDRLASGNFWVLTTKRAGTGLTTTTISSIAIVADQWYMLRIFIYADASRVDFFIDNVLAGSITTNVPTGVAEAGAIALNMLKTLGTTSRKANIDAYYDKYNVNVNVV